MPTPRKHPRPQLAPELLALLVPPSDRAMTIEEWCSANRITEYTGKRIIRAGLGPTLTWVSERLCVITAANNARWLASRSTHQSGLTRQEEPA
jgi:hypothetical protein